MIREIRDVSAALGDGRKAPAEVERDTLAVARRSVVAARPIRRGELLAGRLAIKRPAEGISPMQFWAVEKRRADRDYAENEMIDPAVLGAGG
jgi:sialic acid synthase SpsE